MRRKIPRTMSTQHPDNASIPEWAGDSIIRGEAEIYEAYFAYRELGCMEVMWDAEGKDVDTRVVRKLLEKYGEYFKEKILGEDVFLTYRVPNPKVDVAEQKILLESLVNIPVAYDIASRFYKRNVTPIFEVILPFTTRSDDLIWLKRYYEKVIAGSASICLDGVCRIEEWLGPFKPETIEIIPLIEDFNSILNIKEIITPFIKAAKPEYLRVFIARSDPALNYGLACAVILCKIALSQLKHIEDSIGINIYPILGVGTLPFRGHLSPQNMESFAEEYKGVYTVTIQSALKYDYSIDEVRSVVAFLNENLPTGKPAIIEPHETQALMGVLTKFMRRYQSIVEKIAPLINNIAALVPPRRARKLHIGLFGYSRSVGGISLPRAIPFTCALYTLGIPPEFIGFSVLEDLNEVEWNALRNHYLNLKRDLEAAGVFISWRNLNMLSEMCELAAKVAGVKSEDLRSAIANIISDLNVVEENLAIKLGPRNFTQMKHENAINNFLVSYLDGNNEEAKRHLIEAAKIRRCLG